jgi:hypothetical protein
MNKEEKKMKGKHETVRMWTKGGAVIGAIGFLAFGIIPGFYFGSYGALMMMSHLFGGALQATVLLRVATAAGIIMGVTCVGFMSIVVGSILGTAAGYAAVAVTRPLREAGPAAEAETVTTEAR